jgi:hypothetical protein
LTGKYKGLLEDIHATQTGAARHFETPPPPSPAPLPSANESVKQPVGKRKPGRPKVGKSSNPEFVQVTAYVEEIVHLAVKKALLDLKDTDFSDLVNDLLKKWAKSRT